MEANTTPASTAAKEWQRAMFLSLIILDLESNIYLSNLIDVSNYNLDGLRYTLVYLGFNISWIIPNKIM